MTSTYTIKASEFTPAFIKSVQTLFRGKKIKIRISDVPENNAAEIPNAETLTAITEVETMKKNPKKGKSYTDVDAMMQELLA